VNGCLLDVNVLIALLWPPHEAHARTQRWFAHERRPGLGDLCHDPGRLCSHCLQSSLLAARGFSTRCAGSFCAPIFSIGRTGFWADDLGVAEALAQFEGRLNGHQQVTDGYLLALAIHQKGRLATLDSGVASLLADQSDEKKHLVLV